MSLIVTTHRVFTADTDVLRLGAAVVKTAPHQLLLGPTGLTTVDGPEHMRKRRMQMPAFGRRALAGYDEVMQRTTEEAPRRGCSAWPGGRSTTRSAT